jgi:hypothetical protein
VVAGQLPVNQKATAEAKQVLSYLNTLMSPSAGTLTGMHNWLEDPMGNINNLALPVSGGKYPAVIGGELGPISGQSAEIANRQRAAVANAAIAYWKAGGIPTLTWHCTYPTTSYVWGNVQRATTDAEFNQILTAGDPKNTWLLNELDAIAVHLKTMQNAGVPVLFRPWHEMNGYWFWWGKKSNFAKLWALTYDRLVNRNGLNNLIWVWCPNCMKATDMNIGDYKLYYPGHGQVDVLAWDIYLNEFSQKFHDELYAFGGGKPIAIGEAGGLPSMKTLQASQWRYTWALAWGEPNFSSENTADQKKQFFTDAYAISRDKVKLPTVDPDPNPPTDTTPPTAPKNAKLDRISIQLSWDASTDNVGVTGYEVLKDGAVIGTTSATTYTVTGIAPNQTNRFTIRAKDAAGNSSSESEANVITTKVTAEAPPVQTKVFIKGINFNGAAKAIEGNQWLAETSAGLTLSTVLRHTGAATFTPAVDSPTNDMLNSDIYSSGSISVRQTLANGTYEIYLWNRENFKANFRSYHVKLQDIQVTAEPIGAMPVNQWRKYGPYRAEVKDGVLKLELVKVTGDATISGMAIYKVNESIS